MLSTTSEYALRALTYLASQPRGTAVLGRDLAEHCGIPANYLSKMLLELRNAGIIKAVRGSRGGYSLDRAPEKIHLIEIVELFDGPRARPECFLGHHNKCSDANPCTAHQAWRDVRNAYVDLLVATTLASIAEPLPSARPAAAEAAPGPTAPQGGRQQP